MPHDGRTVTASGFRKRVLYIEAESRLAFIVERSQGHLQCTRLTLDQTRAILHADPAPATAETVLAE